MAAAPAGTALPWEARSCSPGAAAAACNEECAMGATFTSLQSISNFLVLTRFLNISADGSFILSAPSFRNAGCIPSAPGVLGSLCTV